jgi:peptide-methionine (S)-S-oxide reductase
MDSSPSARAAPRPPIDRAAPTDPVQAAFALGCFWGPDAQFGAVEGVVRTCVGYAGGTTPAPTYEALGDHIETVRVEYDPGQCRYDDLLALFWAAHDPTRAPFKRQYQPALFPCTPEQRARAEASVAAQAEAHEDPITTEVVPDASFHRAEAYHQKHKLRRQPGLCDAVQAPYPNEEAFADAPAAALVNGYVGGHRAPRHLDDDAPRLALPDEAETTLRALVERRHDG